MLPDSDHAHAVDPAGLAVDDEPYPLAERAGGFDHVGRAAVAGHLDVMKPALLKRRNDVVLADRSARLGNDPSVAIVVERVPSAELNKGQAGKKGTGHAANSSPPSGMHIAGKGGGDVRREKYCDRQARLCECPHRQRIPFLPRTAPCLENPDELDHSPAFTVRSCSRAELRVLPPPKTSPYLSCAGHSAAQNPTDSAIWRVCDCMSLKWRICHGKFRSQPPLPFYRRFRPHLFAARFVRA